MAKPNFQTTKQAHWIDATQQAVPFKYVQKSDRAKEVLALKIYKTAVGIEAALGGLYLMMRMAFTEIEALLKAEYDLKNKDVKKKGKGNLTWYNFDKSFKIEADVNDIVKWDAALMTEALGLINSYLTSNLSDQNQLLTNLVASAFANSKNQVDTAKVFQLLKFESQVKSKRFQKACELIRQAQTIDKTKLYMRLWVKAEAGDYLPINLNFSNI